METVVVSLGGSVLAPGQPDAAFVRELAAELQSIAKTHRLVVVTGGGGLARAYIEAGPARGADRRGGGHHCGGGERARHRGAPQRNSRQAVPRDTRRVSRMTFRAFISADFGAFPRIGAFAQALRDSGGQLKLVDLELLH